MEVHISPILFKFIISSLYVFKCTILKMFDLIVFYYCTNKQNLL